MMKIDVEKMFETSVELMWFDKKLLAEASNFKSID